MKRNYLLLFFITVMILSFTSCSKDDDSVTDTRDQYLGTWDYNQTGSLTLYQNGTILGTVPINESGTTDITKSGENGLKIGGRLYFVNGSNLSTDPQSYTSNENGVVIVGTDISSGNLGSNLVNINSSITGTWSNSNGASGNFSGNYILVLSK